MAAFAVAGFGPGETLDHHRGEVPEDVRRQITAIGDEIERLGLVEPLEMNRPLDRFAVAAEGEATGGITGDRDHTSIKVGGIEPIDGDLGLAGGAALGQRRQVHEGKADGALDLVDVRPGEEDGRGVGVDAFDRCRQAVRRRVGEEAEDRLLVSIHRNAGTGTDRAAARCS